MNKYSDKCSACGRHLRFMIVAPTLSKDYDTLPTISLQWRLAIRELQRARNVIIIGVSLAPTDTRLAWLLQYGLMGFEHDGEWIDLVYYVDRDAIKEEQERERSVVDRLKRLAPADKVRPHCGGFAPYLDETSGTIYSELGS